MLTNLLSLEALLSSRTRRAVAEAGSLGWDWMGLTYFILLFCTAYTSLVEFTSK